MSLSHSLDSLQERSDNFLRTTGRRPRVLLSRVDNNRSAGQLKALAIVFADAGFDVDISPGFSTHDAIAKMACENDVHIVGISGGHANQADPAVKITDALAAFGEYAIKVYVDNQMADERQMEHRPDFEKRAVRSAAEMLALIGA